MRKMEKISSKITKKAKEILQTIPEEEGVEDKVGQAKDTTTNKETNVQTNKTHQ